MLAVVCDVIKEQLLLGLKEKIPRCTHMHARTHKYRHTLISRLNMIKRLLHLKSVFLPLKHLYVWLFSTSSLPLLCILTMWKCCIAVLSRSYTSPQAPEEPPRRAAEDGKETLQCWPPRAPVSSSGAGRAGRAPTAASFPVDYDTFITSSMSDSRTKRHQCGGRCHEDVAASCRARWSRTGQGFGPNGKMWERDQQQHLWVQPAPEELQTYGPTGPTRAPSKTTKQPWRGLQSTANSRFGHSSQVDSVLILSW